jgi:hypothetical protein
LRAINAGNLNFDAIEVSHAAAVSKEIMQTLALTSGLRDQELTTIAKPQSKAG